MTVVYWLALAFLVYVFVGYPLMLWLVSLFWRRTHRRAPIQPSVSLIIAAHNEGARIEDKIQNSLRLDYPRDQLEIIVASDGSTDATVDIVRSFEKDDVRLVNLQERRGKHHAQMMARDASSGEILVFSDCSITLPPDALRIIVSNFADPSIGCVSSEDRVLEDRRSQLGESLYIHLEMWLRRLEAQVGSLVGVSGSFFAARRELCAKWHPGQSSDFFIPLHAAQSGLRAIVDAKAVGSYGLTRSERAEFHRKVRTIVHGLDVLFTHANLLNPFRYGLFSWQLVSHKLFRWLVPFAALALLLSNIPLWQAGPFYTATLILQATVYLAGVMALGVERLAKVKPFRFASFFLLGNAATITAWLRFGSGERFVTWEPTQRG